MRKQVHVVIKNNVLIFTHYYIRVIIVPAGDTLGLPSKAPIFERIVNALFRRKNQTECGSTVHCLRTKRRLGSSRVTRTGSAMELSDQWIRQRPVHAVLQRWRAVPGLAILCIAWTTLGRYIYGPWISTSYMRPSTAWCGWWEYVGTAWAQTR